VINAHEFDVIVGIYIILVSDDFSHYTAWNSADNVKSKFGKKTVRNQSLKILTFYCCILLRRVRQSPNISQDLGELQTSLSVNTSHDEDVWKSLRIKKYCVQLS
jgi:hypothetical protein